MGHKNEPTGPLAVNVMTFVDRVEKDVPGFRQQYDLLSEFCHPNWRGTAGFFSVFDGANLWADFGNNAPGLNGPQSIGLANLGVALMFFERSYNRVADQLTSFIELCARQAKD